LAASSSGFRSTDSSAAEKSVERFAESAHAARSRPMNFSEKRRYPRLSLFAGALITRQGEGHLSEVRDLSQGGARLARPGNWPGRLDGTYRIYFIFEPEMVIALDAHCLREGAQDLAFEFLPDQEARIGALLHESRFLNQEREPD
jgi:hypothetical protein